MLRPWRTRRAFELALLVLVAGLAAFGVNAALRLALDGIPPPVSTPATAAVPRVEPLEAYAPIAARDIFNPAPAREGLATTSLRLWGVGFHAGEARAVVEDTATRRQELVRVGDTVAGARVVGIAWDHLVLATSDGESVLELAVASSAPVAAEAVAAPAVAPAGPTVRQTGANAYIVDRRELAGAVDNMSGLLTELRAVAEVEDGRPAGFRLFQIKDDSIFRRLGLQDGDVVQRVNGRAVSDPATLLAFLHRLRTEPRVAIDVRRGTQSRTLVYDLR